VANGHITLVHKPLTFQNVFEIDLQHLDYVAPATRSPTGKDYLLEMVLGIRSSSQRIKDILGERKGAKIIDGLLAEVELQREDYLVPFAWDLSMYRTPPINWDPAVPFVSQSNADLDAVRQEAEALVRMEDAGGAINKDMTLTNVGDYVICVSNPSDPLKRPFWVGQVTNNYQTQKDLRVHWLLPPTKRPGSDGKGTKGKNGASRETEDMDVESTAREPVLMETKYVSPSAPPRERAHLPQQPNLLCKIKNFPYAQFRPVMDINTAEKSNSNKGNRKSVIPSFRISYDCCYFSFSSLKPDTRLPTNVLDELSMEQEIQWKG